ncbi:MAG: YajQ family cyclic di-GMP-binding protein [Litorivicinus sp.]
MPSFDIVSEIDNHELQNATDQANKEVTTRFDFKGTNSSFELSGSEIKLQTESEFQLDQMYDMLTSKMTKRGIDIRCLERGDMDLQLKTAKQTITVKQGLESADAKKIVKLIKDEKLKVQASIQGDSVRVTGKKRDDLQTAIALLKEKDPVSLPLQFNNFRD